MRRRTEKQQHILGQLIEMGKPATCTEIVEHVRTSSSGDRWLYSHVHSALIGLEKRDDVRRVKLGADCVWYVFASEHKADAKS